MEYQLYSCSRAHLQDKKFGTMENLTCLREVHIIIILEIDVFIMTFSTDVSIAAMFLKIIFERALTVLCWGKSDFEKGVQRAPKPVSTLFFHRLDERSIGDMQHCYVAFHAQVSPTTYIK